MIVNLARNIPQRKLQLELKIICFCEQSQRMKDYNPGSIQIFFLALSREYFIGLYKIEMQPWVDDDCTISLSKIKMNVDFGQHNTDQIK